MVSNWAWAIAAWTSGEARIDGVPVSEVIRQAIAGHIESRRNDPERVYREPVWRLK